MNEIKTVTGLIDEHNRLKQELKSSYQKMTDLIVDLLNYRFIDWWTEFISFEWNRVSLSQVNEKISDCASNTKQSDDDSRPVHWKEEETMTGQIEHQAFSSLFVNYYAVGPFFEHEPDRWGYDAAD